MSVESASPPVPSEATAPAAPGRRHLYRDLFLISFVILFFELTCIRWFGSMVTFLTFFTNIILMSCFLGMSVGCLAASRKENLIDTVIPLALWTVLAACLVLFAYNHFGSVMIDVGGQGSPQQVFFGTEFRPKDPSRFVIPIEAVAGLFFVLNALMFVGLGQEMGRTFDAIPDRVAAYSVNVLGSLAGIVAFGVASYFQTTPVVWFAVSLGIVLYLARGWSADRVVRSCALLFLIAFLNHVGDFNKIYTYWSPYYRVVYAPQFGAIETNNIGHQAMVRIAEGGPAYVLPHLLNRDAGGGPFGDVLIVGAGSGNDVQAALAHGARHVDAVEIDPVLNRIGRRDHPDRPYDDPRVAIHLDDGRSYLRGTDRAYDLISYSVVDSLVLHSGYSNLRLESFLFTEQAFQDVKAKLKPGGVFAMYNFYRQGWVVGRLAKMAEKVFGTKPLVISLPYQAEIKPSDSQANHFTFLLVGNTDAQAVETIRRKLDLSGAFWVNERPRYNELINAFGPRPPDVAGTEEKNWSKIAPAAVETTGIDRLPTDDWPFLYLREPTVPALNLRGMLMVAVLSFLLLLWFAPARAGRLNGQMFFLGAGFMLLETKGVVHMALLFGSTWVVNSIVFFAILVLILLANLFVAAFRPVRVWPYYVLLIAALGANLCVPMSYYLSLPGAARVVASCAVVFAPVLFAGIAFATAFRESRQPDVDLGSNIGGVIVGGLCENFSMTLGFDRLLVIAIAFYVLSLLLRPRLRAVASLAGAP
jgi:SAM-dependent methyltransferase